MQWWDPCICFWPHIFQAWGWRASNPKTPTGTDEKKKKGLVPKGPGDGLPSKPENFINNHSASANITEQSIATHLLIHTSKGAVETLDCYLCHAETSFLPPNQGDVRGQEWRVRPFTTTWGHTGHPLPYSWCQWRPQGSSNRALLLLPAREGSLRNQNSHICPAVTRRPPAWVGCQ